MTKKAFDLHVYARVWCEDPERAFKELLPSQISTNRALETLDAFSAASKSLRELNEELLPMMSPLGRSDAKGGWWMWFTGADLERDVRLMHVAENVETVADACRLKSEFIQNMIKGLHQEIALLDLEHKKMSIRIELGRLMLESQDYAPHFSATAGVELLERFRRKLANVESLLTAQRLTRAQYELAASNGRAMCERFEEILTLLMPLWYQRMGFELFSRRLETTE